MPQIDDKKTTYIKFFLVTTTTRSRNEQKRETNKIRKGQITRRMFINEVYISIMVVDIAK